MLSFVSLHPSIHPIVVLSNFTCHHNLFRLLHYRANYWKCQRLPSLLPSSGGFEEFFQAELGRIYIVILCFKQITYSWHQRGGPVILQRAHLNEVIKTKEMDWTCLVFSHFTKLLSSSSNINRGDAINKLGYCPNG
jgi:hypothetical protein